MIRDTHKHLQRNREIGYLLKTRHFFLKQRISSELLVAYILGANRHCGFLSGPGAISNKDRKWHHRFPNVVMTTYFTSRNDPQTFERVNKNNEEYIYPWYASMRRLGEHGVIFHDNLSESFVARFETDKIKFVRCRLGKRSMNDERFMIYLKFLLQNPYKKIFMTDVTDVIVNRAPFNMVSGNDSDSVFVGRDRFNLNGQSNYIVGLVKDFECLTGEMVDEGFANCPMYNAGVIGGSYTTILFLLLKMCAEFMKMKNVTDHDMNMMVLNYMLYRHFFDDPDKAFFNISYDQLSLYNIVMNHLDTERAEISKTFRSFELNHDQGAHVLSTTLPGIIYQSDKSKIAQPQVYWRIAISNPELGIDGGTLHSINCTYQQSEIHLQREVNPDNDAHCNTAFIKSGFPVCSPFFAFQFNSDACFIHK